MNVEGAFQHVLTDLAAFVYHTTLQVDHETVQLLSIETAEPSRPANTVGH